VIAVLLVKPRDHFKREEARLVVRTLGQILIVVRRFKAVG
jgi:hypothetical protein